MDVKSLLGAEADSLLGHTCAGVPSASITHPGPDFIDRVMVPSVEVVVPAVRVIVEPIAPVNGGYQ